MNRRRFAFWASFGVFTLGQRLRAGSLDRLAAAMLGQASAPAEHWTVAANDQWWWYERQQQLGDVWVTTGLTTPTNKESKQRYDGAAGYLDDALVPARMRIESFGKDLTVVGEARTNEEHGVPNPERRARHGRPPSQWLRRLQADELRIWLKTIDVPEAGVSGMTYWEHLTRDHSFEPANIEGLDEDEQARLHAAAHYGY